MYESILPLPLMHWRGLRTCPLWRFSCTELPTADLITRCSIQFHYGRFLNGRDLECISPLYSRCCKIRYVAIPREAAGDCVRFAISGPLTTIKYILNKRSVLIRTLSNKAYSVWVSAWLNNLNIANIQNKRLLRVPNRYEHRLFKHRMKIRYTPFMYFYVLKKIVSLHESFARKGQRSCCSMHWNWNICPALPYLLK